VKVARPLAVAMVLVVGAWVRHVVQPTRVCGRHLPAGGAIVASHDCSDSWNRGSLARSSSRHSLDYHGSAAAWALPIVGQCLKST